jgi:hypothetical protein
VLFVEGIKVNHPARSQEGLGLIALVWLARTMAGRVLPGAHGPPLWSSLVSKRSLFRARTSWALG